MFERCDRVPFSFANSDRDSASGTEGHHNCHEERKQEDKKNGGKTDHRKSETKK